MSTEQAPLAELMEMWRDIHLELDVLRLAVPPAAYKPLTSFTDPFETRLMELAKEDVELHEALSIKAELEASDAS